MQNSLNIPQVGANTIQGSINTLGYLNSSQKIETETLTALNCSDPKLYLYKLDDEGNRIEPEIDAVNLNSDGTYTFNLKNKKIQFFGKTPKEPLIVQMKGCHSGIYFRPVTSSTGQNISMGSTILGFLLNTSLKSRLSHTLAANPGQLEELLNILKDTNSLENAFETLASNQVLSMKFVEIFGAEPAILTQAAPEIVSESIPDHLSELVSTSFSVTATHFNKNYQALYEWKWDSQVIGSSSHINFVPGANFQGKHILSLSVGEKDGASFKDGSPLKTLFWTLQVSNNVLPMAPSLTLKNPVVAPSEFVNTRTLGLGITTGNQFAQCSSFSYLALSESSSSQPPPDSAYTMTCYQNGLQNLNYTLESSGDGSKSIYLWAKDASGVVSQQPSVLEVNLDTLPPVVSFASYPAVTVNSSSSTFFFTATDLASGFDHFECQIDNGGYANCSNPETIASLGDGIHHFDVKAYDKAGNSSSPVRRSWTIDTQLPVLNLISKPASLTKQTSAQFVFTAADSGSGINQTLCSWDGAVYEVCVSPVTKTVGGGPRQFSLKAIDIAGNVSSVSSYNWTVDLTAPTVILTSSPVSLTNSPSATFSFIGTDWGGGSVSQYECGLNGAPFSVCQTPMSYLNLADGTHTFQVRAIDSVGNVGQAITYSWTIDLTTPMASITSGPGVLSNQTSATFSFSSNPPPSGSIVGYECQLDSSAWVSCSSPTTKASLSPGVHTFSLRSIDNNSNRSSATNYTWTVDVAAPALNVTSQPEVMTNTTSAMFIFQATDTGGGSVSGYECKVDTATYSSCSSPFSLSNLSEGSHSFYVKVTDTAGNTSLAHNYAWTVDLTPPTPTLGAHPAAVDGSSSAVFNFALSDNNVNNIAGAMCSLDGQAYQACSSPKSYTSLSAGTHQWALIGTDNAGNTSVGLVYSWVIDQTPPTVTVISKPNSLTNTTVASFSFSAVDFGGGSVAQYMCSLDNASFTTCSSPISYNSLAQGLHTFKIKAVDSVGNVSDISIESWSIDLIAPTVAISSPSSNGVVVSSSQISSYPLSGTCTESDTLVVITGALTKSIACSSGVWSTTADFTALSDGVLTINVSQTDIAGNISSPVSRTVIKDTIAPSIAITSIPAQKGGTNTLMVSWSVTELNVPTGAVFNVQLSADGSSWQSLSSVNAIAGSNSSKNYSLSSIPLAVTDTSSAAVKITLSDAAGNTTVSTSNAFVIDSTPPVVSSVVINNGASYAGSSIVNVRVGLSDVLNPSGLFIKLAAADTGTNDCQSQFVDSGWQSWTSLSQNFSFTISPVDGQKKICAWGRDAVGNITIMSPSSGTSGVDYSTIQRQANSPPQVTALNVYNTVNSTQTYALNQGVTVTWSASSQIGLDNNALSIAYSTNGTTWYDVVTKMDSSISTNVTWLGNLSGNPTSANGTYTSFAAPSAGYFILRVVVRDIAGNSSVAVTSQPQNTGNWSVFAGSTDRGDSGSGLSAALYSDGSSSGGKVIAVNPLTNDIYAMDHGFGIRKLEIQSGKVSTFIPTGALNLPDSGTLSLSSRVIVGGASGMVIDSNGVMYYSTPLNGGAKIYKINLATNQVQFFAGGGTDNSTSATAANVYIAASAMELDASGHFYFLSECNPTAPSHTSPKKLMMANINSDGSFGAITLLAGTCTFGTATYGQSSLTQPLFYSTAYSQLTTFVPINPNLIYFSTYGGNSVKIVNGVVYSANIGVNSGMGVISYDRKNNRIYRPISGGSVTYFSPINTSANGGESLVTLASATGTAGNCVQDGVDAAQACVSVDNGLSFDSNGTAYFTDGLKNNAPNGYRIRYVDGSSKVRTIFGSLPFYGDGLLRGLIRGTIGGIYYKKSSELNTTAFPAGLYLVSPYMVFGRINESDSIYQTLWGNQQGNNYAAPTGTAISSSISMGVTYVGGNGKVLAFDSNGLPWMRASNQLIQVNASNQIVVKASASGSWWETGGAPATSSLFVFGGYQNLALKGSDGAFLIGGYFLSPTYDPIPQIRFLDFTNAVNTKVMGGSYLNSQLSAMSADVATPGNVQAAALYYGCINQASCSIQYVASQDRLYFLSTADRYIRYISNPTNPSLSTLTTMPLQAPTTGTKNFIFKEDLSQIFILDVNGGLYCMDINSGKAWCNNSTNLYPYTATMGSFVYGANQMTWKDANTLLISNHKGQVLQYILNP